ncbi:MAG: polysaccharide biosynthesis/export family protein [Calditrichaeota bacterium]|nr:polysaccharide biosynthesis/export family protein [Calditrichota bacterium]
MIISNENARSHIALIILILFFMFEIFPWWHLLQAGPFEPPPPQNPQQLSFRSRTFHPGDAVQISVYPDTTSFLHGIYKIDGNGEIYLPIKGKVKISEMTQNELESFIKQNFTAYLRYPEINVRPLIRVSLLGGFANPGLYYLDPEYTIWDAVRLAGGTLREDGLKKMKWERDKDVIRDNLIPFYESGRGLRQIGFRSGDQIWTPTPRERTFWTVFRDVAAIASTAATLYFTYVTIVYVQSGRYSPRGF